MLEIDGVSMTYSNGVQALKGVQLSLGKGLFGLLGPNGAGKSTLMRMIATLQKPDQGQIRFGGKDIWQSVHAYRERLGYLPQYFGVYPRVSAQDLLSHFAAMRGFVNRRERRERVDHLLAQTNLYQHRKKAVSGFSGGMRQRFGIAQALLGDPDLLIVDEPTSGLDPEERHRFHNLLVVLGEKKIILFSTHIVRDVAELCSQMAVLVSGEILLKGEPKALIQQLNGRIWKRTMAHDALDEVASSAKVISKRWAGGQLQVHVIADAPPPGFQPAHATLEDVYFSTLKPQQNCA